MAVFYKGVDPPGQDNMVNDRSYHGVVIEKVGDSVPEEHLALILQAEPN